MAIKKLTQVNEDISIVIEDIVGVVRTTEERLEDTGKKKYYVIWLYLNGNPAPIVYTSVKKEDVDLVYELVHQF